MAETKFKSVAIIVAHPDDETLWAGGTVMSHPTWKCFIVSLCRKNDTSRAPRFYKALKLLKSQGNMGDLDDEPDQVPLDKEKVEQAILSLLPQKHFDLIISHSPSGEYTRHIRHEEAGEALINLWNSDKISASEIRLFAYEDGDKKYYPKAIENASIYQKLTKRTWHRKFSIITETYGFKKESWEAKTTPAVEAFWHFTNPVIAKKWLDQLKIDK